jgi:hypothetical protein
MEALKKYSLTKDQIDTLDGLIWNYTR